MLFSAFTSTTPTLNLFLQEHLTLLYQFKARTLHINSLYEDKSCEYTHNNMIKYNLFSHRHMIYNLPDELVRSIYENFMNECILKCSNLTGDTKKQFHTLLTRRVIKRNIKTKDRILFNYNNNLKTYNDKTIWFITNDLLDFLYSRRYNNSHSLKDPFNTRCYYTEPEPQINQNKNNNHFIAHHHRIRRLNRIRFTTFLNGFTRKRIMSKLLKDKGLGDGSVGGDEIVWKKLEWSEMVFGIQRYQEEIKDKIIQKTMNYSYDYGDLFRTEIAIKHHISMSDIELLWDKYNEDPFKRLYFSPADNGIEVGFNQGRFWENRYDADKWKNGRINSLLKVRYKYNYQQYQKIQYTNEKKLRYFTPGDMNDWWKMSIQDRKYAKWYIDLNVLFTAGNTTGFDNISLKAKNIRMIKKLEYDFPNTNYNQVVKDRYIFITKTHPNKSCRLYNRKLYWKYLNSIYTNPNDYGKDKVYSKLFGRKWATRDLYLNRQLFKQRVKQYKIMINHYPKYISGNGRHYMKRNKHIQYLQSYHSY
tara:strand:- start:818 stop:2407 length:1590 start_codon:yes stop_codon:yes gene_type:complete